MVPCHVDLRVSILINDVLIQIWINVAETLIIDSNFKKKMFSMFWQVENAR